MNNDLPFFSVIVTTYNRKELLKETINSILNQTYKNFELIVVDNYSDYDFFSYIKSLNDNKIKAFQNNNDGIIAVNRNYGIGIAKGEYIAFCDDDDLWVYTKLEKCINYIKAKKTHILFSDQSYIDQDGNILYVNNKFLKKLFLFRLFFPPKSILLLFNNSITLSSSVVKRSLLIDTHFSENKELIAAEDYYLWLKLNRNYAIHYLPEKLIYYRIHTNSISNSIKKRLYLNLSINKLLDKDRAYNNGILFLVKVFIYLKFFLKNNTNV